MRSPATAFLFSILAALLAGCATRVPGDARHHAAVVQGWVPLGLAGGPPSTPWQVFHLPGKAATVFRPVRHDGRPALEARAEASASLVRTPVHIQGPDLGRLAFSWQVPALIDAADLALRHADDSPVRIVLAFEGDRSRWSARDAMVSELARAVTGEELPFATLMYVWCNQRPVGTVVASPRTERIRKIVVESGPQRLGRWLDYERDVRADYERAYGEAPGALVGVALMTDTDNTRASARAWYGPLRFEPSLPQGR